jgi:hypothetical protein
MIFWGMGGVPSRMTGERESVFLRERNVRTKASLFVLDCFVPRNDASGEESVFLRGEGIMLRVG